MKKTTVLIILVLGILAVFCGYRVGAEPASNPEPEPGFRIAVVNVAQVLSQCQENQDKEKELSEKNQKIKADQAQLASDAEAIKQELENALVPGSKEFMERRKEWFDKRALHESLEEYRKESLTLESQVWTESLYQKFLAEVEKVSRLEGVTLMLNKDETPLQGRSLSELYNAILTRKVLYSAAKLDLTAIVQENMDLSYEREKAANSATVLPNP